MRLPFPRTARFLLLAWMGVALATSGCGTSAYDKLVAQRASDLRAAAKFRGLFDYTQIPGTPVQIRVPMAFREAYQADSAHPDDGEQISPDRFQPPFLELPGLKICYEGHASNGTGLDLPYYCYLGAVEAKPGDAEKLRADLLTQLKSKLKETPDEWQAIDAETPAGKAVQWQKLRVVAEQPFRHKEGDKVVSTNFPGIFELWVHDAENYVAIVAWRAPQSVEGASSPQTAPADPLLALKQNLTAKPDLTNMPALTAGTLQIVTEQPAP